jgi:APA family basic amino acid/polyamine antiporter
MKNRRTEEGLKREIGLFSATVLVVANMVGTGIFAASGYMMNELERPATLLLCWLLGGVFALCGALCYGELGARFTRAGGEYIFLRESFGPSMGFLSGWISLIVGFSAPIAAAGIAFATYLFRACALDAGAGGGMALSLFGLRLATFSWLNLTAAGLIILFSMLHYHSLTTGSRVQNMLTLFKISLLLIFVIAGFAVGDGSFSNFQASSGGGGISFEGIAVSLIFAAFAYSGWNAAAYLGGEITRPGRNIPLSLGIGTLSVVVLYLLINAVYIYAMPAEQMRNVLDVGAEAAVHLFGGRISRYFSAAAAIGLLSVVSAMIMAGPRVYYAMARDGVFFHSFARVNKSRHTPAASIFLQAAIAVLLVLTSVFNALLVYIGFTLSFFAVLTVSGMIWLRYRRPDQTPAYKTFGYPITPLLFIFGNLWIIIYSIKSRPLSTLFGLATIAAGILLYACLTRRAIRLKRTLLTKQKPYDSF